MNIKTAIVKACKNLRKKNIRSSQLDAEILMSKVLEKERDYIILNQEKVLNGTELSSFEKLINERSKRKPIAYIIKKKNFWKYQFKIVENVLIPRPDTELVVEQALKVSKNKSKLQVLEIGVGSGCILLTILKEKKDFYGTGIDISKKCINNSGINSNILGLTNRAKFFKSDVDNFKYGKYDLIISNPPYIKKIDLKYLEKDIIEYEPKLALDGGLDGMSEIRKVIKKSSELIKINGKLVLEIAFDQKNRVMQILRNNGFYINDVLKDFAKNDRCIVSTKI